MNKSIKRFLSSAITLAMALCMAVPAFAADYEIEDEGVHKDGTGSDVIITIEKADVTQGSGSIEENGWVTMTVPATIPMIFKAAKGPNGESQTVVPTNWTITNNDPNTGVHITDMTMTGKDGWKLAGGGTDMKLQTKDTTMLKFSMGFKGGDLYLFDGNDGNTATLNFEDGDMVIPAGQSQVFAFDVERTVFTEAKVVTAYELAINFDWN